jgi:hypothetical protein
VKPPRKRFVGRTPDGVGIFDFRSDSENDQQRAFKAEVSGLKSLCENSTSGTPAAKQATEKSGIPSF